MIKFTPKFFIALIIAVFVFALATVEVNAASMYLSPETKVLSIGQTFNVDVIINTDDVAINAAEGVIHYQTSVLELERVDVSNSVFNFWIENPSGGGETGTVSFIGGTPKGN